jgi:hypothetical protein
MAVERLGIDHCVSQATQMTSHVGTAVEEYFWTLKLTDPHAGHRGPTKSVARDCMGDVLKTE